MYVLESTTRLPASFSITSAKVLVVEDDKSIAELMTFNLTGLGYAVTLIEDGHDALNLLKARHIDFKGERFDLIVLDIMLPQISGLEICRFLRANGDTTPLLIINAQACETEQVLALEIGADDCLSKSFSFKEFTARCHALLRRQKLNGSSSPSCLQYGELRLYPDECRVTLKGEEIPLSPKEYSILKLLMTYPRRIWSREQLMDRIWEIGHIGNPKTVDVHIRWLRRKIEDY